MTDSLIPTLSDPSRPAPPVAAADVPGALVAARRMIWLYFWLLLLEGALRKWVMPGLSNQLLLIRDPVVIAIYVLAGVAGVFPINGFVRWTIGLGLASFFISELGGSGNMLVSLYGLRTNFLHLPLLFLVGNIFDKNDLDRMARWLFITTIPMALLVLAQFRASPDSWLNNGAGGGANGQIESSFGRIRPPGTFSFTAGLVSYLAVTAAFALHALMQKKSKNLKYATLALPALALMVGISGSRAALGSMTLVLAAVVVVCVRKPVFFQQGMKTVVWIGAVGFALASWSEFQQGLEVIASRIEGGGGLKDGILLRFIQELFPFHALMDAPFFGKGLGMGTNAASAFLYGKVNFGLGEGEWERVLRESGPILGLSFIALRICILGHLASRAFAALNRDNPLPLLLLAACALGILSGQFGVPMLLGWAVFSSALCHAAANYVPESAVLETPVQEPEHAVMVARSFRGRSIYADQLHGEIEDPDIARFGP